MSTPEYHRGYEVGYEAGRDAALTLARDAVAALSVDAYCGDWCVDRVRDDALAAIDALKGEQHQHGPGSDPACAACRANGCAYCGSSEHVAKGCPDA